MEIIKSNAKTDTTEFYLLLAELTTIDITLEVEKLKKEAVSLVREQYGETDLGYDELLCNSILFNFGYIQGVRNERAKRRN